MRRKGRDNATPFFDRKCGSCGTEIIDSFEPVTAPVIPCADCGELTERVWLTKPATVIGDEMDHVQVNGTATPIRFRSKGERRRWLKEHGWREKDEFKPLLGSDKSKFGDKSWATNDPVTAANVKELLERAFQQKPERSAPPLNMRIRTYTGEMTTAEVQQHLEATR